MVIDTHCHILKEEYDNPEEIINEMKDNILFISGYNDATNHEVLELISKYPNVYGTIGIHPSEIENIDDSAFQFIEDNILNKKIVGIGEIGLDYHFDDSKKEKQKEIFNHQLSLAEKYHKTVVIHSRDAIEDTYNILKKHKVKSVIHCFSSSYEMAIKFTKLGSKLGIGGVLTFKNSSKLKEIVEKLDLSNFVLETDSPYLTPEPYRGTKNKPIYTLIVAAKIAEIKNLTKEEVLAVTTENALSQFDLTI